MKSSTIFSASLFVAFAAAAPTTITITVDDNASQAQAQTVSAFHFTRSFNVVAIPSEVRNGTVEVTGAADATGYFNYGLNSDSDTICYNITLINVVGDYLSPALTATHIHQAVKGASGPPRIAFPNPVGDDVRRTSMGCLTGPFLTGVKAEDGSDTGTGFTVRQIEDDPASFFTDSHTALFPIGVVRGQLA